MPVSKKKKKPYDERTDVEKIQSNWTKISGLLDREEWSSAVVRAATATEIAANLVVREEFIDTRGLDTVLVDHFLRWANGIQGKFDKLILPAIKGKDHEKAFKSLKKRVEDINTERNAIVHSGKFITKTDAKKVVAEAKEIIISMLEPYYDNFELDDLS
ncbi:hypothetical protein [Methylobacter sp.]|uniref:hypothetical protein n=1 Tax=Methylobacter sp. TaxID=2051955 RepID=UPI00120C074F|nr:hypothetical protein [Methylobacter sp.]TAK63725.1 MAG: hypothetical protein EPO18_05910 [Methylobacter sp.]